ncbi:MULTISPECIES: type III pantothenate kinase [unclassified Oleiphilus]|uniref:type III pantothenate kinase n=3 Tax=Oleiphilus TaxID=141450 RepID=UPI0007C313D6|nr:MULTISPECIES: type III pantothenate kinase [unclassified Oleiphilus]KZY47345.1 hypothetical protein A3732_00880 [Oleiphilus sp. HI0050]KZY95536.1 hypothetical protein A3743_05365 [Oleiphilus sp. HI0072]KZY37479.1 hypothetical protein A3729_16580 [Oleiphilus sp. HI0043]KZZ35876.1 hypothetical protein A3756_14475 [Oleiphilus sp. HI0086]KZZ37507.1 hypothetical protein A3757_11000 [Oleiphilus sp. HI0117]
MLLLDCGNTRIKWCLAENNKIIRSGEELLSALDPALLAAELGGMSFNRVLVASVRVSEVLDSLLDALQRMVDVKIYAISHDDMSGQQFAYDEVKRLGVDRCLVISAVRDLYQGACMVIDSGSALTADLIDGDGRHIGGYIFPGCKMLQDSLVAGTSKIVLDDDVQCGLSPGRNTEQCVVNGVHIMVSQTISYLESQCQGYGINKVILTGGDAKYIAGFIVGAYELRPVLVFEGMAGLFGSRLEGELH